LAWLVGLFGLIGLFGLLGWFGLFVLGRRQQPESGILRQAQIKTYLSVLTAPGFTGVKY